MNRGIARKASRSNQGERGRSAFTLIELLVVVAVIALLIGLVAPAISKARSAGLLAACLSNQRSLGVASATYSFDSDEAIPHFWWASEVQPGISVGDTTLDVPKGDDFDYIRDYWISGDAAAQNAHMAMLMQKRVALRGIQPELPILGYYQPEPFTHLLLESIVEDAVADGVAICPADSYMTDIAEGRFEKYAGEASQATVASYASSYVSVPAAGGPDGFQEISGPKIPGWPTGRGMSIGNHLFQTVTGTADFHRVRSLHEVSAPSAKVSMHEDVQHHYGVRLVYADRRARVNVMMFDGSASNRATADANLGWDARNPDVPFDQVLRSARELYDSETNEPAPGMFAMRAAPLEDTTVQDLFNPVYRWTAYGLKGNDF